MKPPRKNSTNSKYTTLVAVWMPTELVRQMDAAAKQQDLDRSKLLRKALRQAIRPS
jgi:metal-responsive CopG/Arc/MetJ family transcriptional regulator